MRIFRKITQIFGAAHADPHPSAPENTYGDRAVDLFCGTPAHPLRLGQNIVAHFLASEAKYLLFYRWR